MKAFNKFSHKSSLQTLFSMLVVVGVATVVLVGQSNDSPSAGISVADMDHSIQPGDDFYRYANGQWLQKTVIPPDRAGVSVFAQLDDISKRRVVALIEDLMKSAPTNEGERKIADLYRSYMDEAGIEANGLKPLQAEFAAIYAIKDKGALA